MPLGQTFAEEAEPFDADTHGLLCPACCKDEDSCQCGEDGPIAEFVALVRR